jgi:NAD(P)H dehydrogenase (quinone)
MLQNILVTGASGKTGKAVLTALSQAGFLPTALAHKDTYEPELIACGAKRVIIGDLRSVTDLKLALREQDGIYHICPNMTSDEFEIGKRVINICKDLSVRRFVYHSVLHPQIQSMPHHWQKLLIEEELQKSGLDYSILQPTAYMQNILGYKEAILSGIFEMPYRAEAEISLVSLSDVGSAAAKVFSDDKTIYGTYELVGTTPLSQNQVADSLTMHIKQSVTAKSTGIDNWYKIAKDTGMPEYVRETLREMFLYYDNFGLAGSPFQLTCLLDRKPITIEQFLQAEFIL